MYMINFCGQTYYTRDYKLFEDVERAMSRRLNAQALRRRVGATWGSSFSWALFILLPLFGGWIVGVLCDATHRQSSDPRLIGGRLQEVLIAWPLRLWVACAALVLVAAVALELLLITRAAWWLLVARTHLAWGASRQVVVMLPYDHIS